MMGGERGEQEKNDYRTARAVEKNISMNSFHLNPELRKISSPIRVVIEEQEMGFRDGVELVAHSFDKPYRVEKIRAEESSIILDLVENSLTPTNWAGEEQTSFF